MQFQVPQFIETEDKIVGPLTIKQFLYVAAAFVISFLLLSILRFWLWFLVATVLGITSISLAFIKVNGRPMAGFLLATFSYLWKPRVYLSRPINKENAPKIKMPQEIGAISKTKFPTASAIPLSGGIKNLLERLITSKSAVPKRERPFPPSHGLLQKEVKERYEFVKKITGDREIAKRIDYR